MAPQLFVASRAAGRRSRFQVRNALQQIAVQAGDQRGVSDRFVITHRAIASDADFPSVSPVLAYRRLIMHQMVIAVCSATAGHKARPTRSERMPKKPRIN